MARDPRTHIPFTNSSRQDRLPLQRCFLRKEHWRMNMRTIAKGLLALASISAAAAFGPVTGSAQAQGFYIDTPGVHVGVGHRHRHYYRDYDGYAYDYAPYRGRAYGG